MTSVINENNERELKDLLLRMKKPRDESTLINLNIATENSDVARRGIDLGVLKLDESIGVKLSDYDTDLDISTIHLEKLRLSYQLRPVNNILTHKLDVWELSDQKLKTVRNKLSVEAVDQEARTVLLHPTRKGFLPEAYDISKRGAPAVTDFDELSLLYNKLSRIVPEINRAVVEENLSQREVFRRQLIDIFTASEFDPYDKNLDSIVSNFGSSRYSVDLGVFTIPKSHRVYMRRPWGGWDEKIGEPDHPHQLPGKEVFAVLNSFYAKGQRKFAMEAIRDTNDMLRIYEVDHYDYSKIQLQPVKNMDMRGRERNNKNKTLYKFDEHSFLTMYERIQAWNELRQN